MPRSKRILLGTPAAPDLSALTWRLGTVGFGVQVCGSLSDIPLFLSREPFDGLILSLDFEGQPPEYLPRIAAQGPRVLVCATRVPTLDGALLAMRVGALDFLQEPLDPERVVDALVRAFVREASSGRGGATAAAESEHIWRGLSERERQVVDALYAGVSPRDIARSLAISHYTVRNHLRSIYGKLGVHSQRELLSLGRPQPPGMRQSV